MRKKNLENIFLREKPAKSLLFLKKAGGPTYASLITKEIDSTYVHTLNVLSKLEGLGLVTFEEVGRIKLVRLTELGVGVAHVLEAFVDVMGLVNFQRKIERFYQKKVLGRTPGKLDRVGVSKRLARYRAELKRWMKGKPKLKEHAEKLLKRIDEISKA